MCTHSASDDLNQSLGELGNSSINLKASSRCESPVFRCVNLNKPNLENSPNSSEYDIPSYQVHQSGKSQYCGSETSETLLPFSPFFTPILPSIRISSSIRSLETFPNKVSFDKSCSSSLNRTSMCKVSKDTGRVCGVFKSLGMMDKDISWVSSMASPPPAQVPDSEFNTLEKATFFPEEKFRSIQPRALFSPTQDDDFGCMPLTFSSDSEDENSYQTNMRLSDVCATLKHLDVRSSDRSPERACKEDAIKSEDGDLFASTSPVIRTKRQKGRKKKKKCTLVKSPDMFNLYEFRIGECLEPKPVVQDKVGKEISEEHGENVDGLMEDDSFQCLSFTGIDELCKTLVNTKGQSAGGETTPINSVSKSYTIQKHFYVSKTDSEVYPVTSKNEPYTSADTLESYVKITPKSHIKKSLTNRGIVRLDRLESPRTDATKRSRSDLSETKDYSKEKKLKMEDVGNWDNVSNYLSESQLNVSDSEIFETLEKLEKTLAGQESQGSEKNLSQKEDEGGDKKVTSKNMGLNTTEKRFFSDGFIVESVSGVNTQPSQSEKRSKIPAFPLEPPGKKFYRKCDENDHKVFSNTEDVKEKEDGCYCEGNIVGTEISGRVFKKDNLITEECGVKPLSSLENSIVESVDKDRNVSDRVVEALEIAEEGRSKISGATFEGEKQVTKAFDIISKKVVEGKRQFTVNCAEHEVTNIVNTILERPQDLDISGGLSLEFSTALGSKILISKDILTNSELTKVLLKCVEVDKGKTEKSWREVGKTIVLEKKLKDLENGGEKNSTNSPNTLLKEKRIEIFNKKVGNNLKIVSENIQELENFAIARTRSFSEKESEFLEKCQKNEVKNIDKNLKTISKLRALEVHVKYLESVNEGVSFGFTSASGSKIAISKEALEKGRNFVRKCHEDLNSDCVKGLKMVGNLEMVSEKPGFDKFGVIGDSADCFKTSNWDVLEKSRVSEKLEGLTHPIGCGSSESEECHCARIEGTSEVTEDFSVPKVEIVKTPKQVLEDASEKQTQFTEQSDVLVRNHLEMTVALKKDHSEAFLGSLIGFKAASGREVTVSEKALEKGKQLLAKWNEDTGKDFLSYSKAILQPKYQVLCDTQKINENISKKQQQFVPKHHENVIECSLPSAKTQFLQKGAFGKHLSTFKGFTTASGADVRVSEEALEKGRQLLTKCDEDLVSLICIKDSQINSAADSNVQIVEKTQASGIQGRFTSKGGRNLGTSEGSEVISGDTENNYVGDCFQNHFTESCKAVSECDVAASENLLEKNKYLEREEEKYIGSVIPLEENVKCGKKVSKIHDEYFSEHDSATQLDSNCKESTRVRDEILDDCRGLLESIVLKLNEDSEKKTKLTAESLPVELKEISEKCHHKKNLFAGFKTGSGKKILVSEEALEKGRQHLMEWDKNSTSALLSKENLVKDEQGPKITKHSFGGLFESFRTGLDRKLSISDKALENGGQFLVEFDRDMFLASGEFDEGLIVGSSEELHEISPPKTTSGVRQMIGGEAFRDPTIEILPSSGSKVLLSEEALGKKGQFLTKFDDSSTETTSENLNGVVSHKYSLEMAKKGQKNIGVGGFFEGFKTGSGRKVVVSDKALERGRQLLAECDKNSLDRVCPRVKVNVGKSKRELKNIENSVGDLFEGSKTVFDKERSIFKKVLEKERELLADYGEHIIERYSEKSADFIMSQKITEKKTDIENNSVGEPFAGFTTGSGKKVTVSGKALEKGKEFLAECDEDIVLASSVEVVGNSHSKTSKLEYNARAISTRDSFAGFITASGSKVSISKEALEKGKKILVKCDEAVDEVPLDRTGSEWSEKDEKIFETSLVASQSVPVPKDKKVKHEIEINKLLEKVCATREKSIDSKESLQELEYMSGFSTDSCSKASILEESSTGGRGQGKCNSNLSVDVSTFERGFVESTNISSSVKKLYNTLGNSVELSRIAVEAREVINRSESTLMSCKQGSSLGRLATEQSGDALMTFTMRSGVKRVVSGSAKCSETRAQDSSDQFVSTPARKQSTTMGKTNCVEDDWEEIVPSWLHIYNTSPSMASDRTDLSPVVSYEDGKFSRIDKEFIVKSPVLGRKDRFYNKIKRRKLEFDEETTEEQKSSFMVPYKSGKKTGDKVKRIGSDLSIDFSVPFKKARYLEVDFDERNKEDLSVNEGRAKARLEQEKLIKEKQKIKPLKGSLLMKKTTEKQKKWREYVGGKSPEVYSEEFLKSLGVRDDVLGINFQNALEFKFKGEEFYGSGCMKNIEGIPVGDGSLIILDEDNAFGVEEIKRGFLASPGVQPNLISEGWLKNHYKWIVWKLAHYERSFPRIFGGRSLTPNNLLLQLKYRYDREIDRNERSALKKILERDETSIRRMVLCVCSIRKLGGGNSGYELILTDGWYSCAARTDPAMTPLIESGKVFIGMKLVIQGAILVNCDQGASPLEIKDDVYLKICTNSTRRIRWDTQLGFQKNPGNLLVSLGSILPQGGQVSRVDVIVVRVYPVLFMEKTSDGHHVTRNRRSEEKADAEFRKMQERRLEAIYNQVQSEMQKSMKARTQKCEDTEESSYPSSLQVLSVEEENFLKETDLLSRELSEKVKEKLEKEKLVKRNVSQFLRVKVVDFRKPNYNNPAVLSIWNPNEEVISLLSEGKVVSVTNVTVSHSSRRRKPLQINSTRQTQFRRRSHQVKYPARHLTRLQDVSSRTSPAFEEVDLVGVVTHVQELSYGSRSSQTVYLTDLDFHFVGIVFWGSCKDYGWENVLLVSSVVACINLQWNKNCSFQEVPSLQVSENSVFTENPKMPHLKEEMSKLKEKMPKDTKALLLKFKEELLIKLENSKWRGNNSNKNSSGNESMLKHTGRPSRSCDGFASSTPVRPGALLSLGDVEPSPIQKRIEKLQIYGEPPPLIPLITTNKVRKFKKKL